MSLLIHVLISVEVDTWMSKYIPNKTIVVINYTSFIVSWTLLAKGAAVQPGFGYLVRPVKASLGFDEVYNSVHGYGIWLRFISKEVPIQSFKLHLNYNSIYSLEMECREVRD